MVYPDDLDDGELEHLLGRYGLELVAVTSQATIPGSYWGDAEAGLIGNRLYARRDTPVHSILHEGCHYVCMDPERRRRLHTDAAGGYDEENGVCYLQIVLAAQLRGMGQAAMFADMDDWGYSFRLGSAGAWFEGDAEDAATWLQQHRLIGPDHRPTWLIRDS